MSPKTLRQFIRTCSFHGALLTVPFTFAVGMPAAASAGTDFTSVKFRYDSREVATSAGRAKIARDFDQTARRACEANPHLVRLSVQRHCVNDLLQAANDEFSQRYGMQAGTANLSPVLGK